MLQTTAEEFGVRSVTALSNAVDDFTKVSVRICACMSVCVCFLCAYVRMRLRTFNMIARASRQICSVR